MKISIKKKLSDIQKEFNSKFPYLRLEFYQEQRDAEEGKPSQQLLNADRTIKEVSPDAPSEDLNIDGEFTVSTLKEKFMEKFGVNIQIFRKSGDSWMQTTNK